MVKDKLWFSLYTRKEYEGNDLPFIDISSIKGIKELEQNHIIIKDELNEYLKANSLNNHFNITMVEKDKTWKVQGLRGWCLQNYKKQKYFPKTMALLNAIPHVTSISFNLLEPQSKIKSHQGDTNAIIRCHLGLKVPADAPACALKVKEETKGWEEGKVFGFTDAFTHDAWNLTDETRIILLFDIIKPEFIKQKVLVCATVRVSLLIQFFGNYFPSIYNWNRERFKGITLPFICMYCMLIPLKNIYRKLRY